MHGTILRLLKQVLHTLHILELKLGTLISLHGSAYDPDGDTNLTLIGTLEMGLHQLVMLLTMLMVKKWNL